MLKFFERGAWGETFSQKSFPSKVLKIDFRALVGFGATPRELKKEGFK